VEDEYRLELRVALSAP